MRFSTHTHPESQVPTPVSSVPGSGRVSLWKAQDSITDTVIHHGVVATLGLGVF